MKNNNRSLALGLVLLGLVLLPTLAAAGDQQSCLKLKNIHASNDALQPGATYEVNLEFEPASSDCGVPLEIAGQAVAYPISLKPDAPSGLQARWTGRSYHKLDIARGVAAQLTLILGVTALPQMAPGEYSIPVVVNYGAVDSHDVVSPQQITVQVPVTVVAPGAKINRQPNAIRWWEPLLMIPLVPLWVLMGILGLTSEC
jgi:hypothetical protein